MSRVSACRVCLSSELNMYAIADTPLQAVYEKLTGSELQSADARPACVCYICLHQLRKCDSFMRRAVKADTLLTQIITTNSGLTSESMDMIERNYNLKWKFGLSKTEHEDVHPENHRQDKPKEELSEVPQSVKEIVICKPEGRAKHIEVKREHVKSETNAIGTDCKINEIKCQPTLDQPLTNKPADGNTQMTDQLVLKVEFENIPGESSTDRRKLDAEAEDEAAESADADNTSENSARQNVAKYNEKTKKRKSKPFKIVKRENTAMQRNTKKAKGTEKPGASLIVNVDIKHGNEANLTSSSASFAGNITADNSTERSDVNAQPNEKRHKCEHCGFAFTQKSALIRHVRTHTGEKPFQHTRVHTGEKPYKCEYCSYSSSYKHTLINHRRTHTGEKPFKCEHCAYSSYQRQNLMNHIRNHTGEKPHKCEHCSHTFNNKSHLVKHVRTHTGEKPFKCEHCSYRCSQESSLVTHGRTHTGERPYQCERCSYCCSLKKNLMRHMRTHTGEKPYKCEHCSYSFSQKAHLVRHYRTHTGERPYRCEYCGYSCNQNYGLKVHLRTHTKHQKTL